MDSPSTVTREDVCGYRTCSILMAKVFFDRQNSKDKNWRRCFQGYQGDIGFIWFVNRISVIFEYVRLLFYADDMKLFLRVRGFQDCMKIQSDVNKLSEWCERKSLFLLYYLFYSILILFIISSHAAVSPFSYIAFGGICLSRQSHVSLANLHFFELPFLLCRDRKIYRLLSPLVCLSAL
jgi:hypothetical protein